MSTFIILFVVGYLFHLIYKLIDKGFRFLVDLKHKREDS
jgi:hypothetical protein